MREKRNDNSKYEHKCFVRLFELEIFSRHDMNAIFWPFIFLEKQIQKTKARKVFIWNTFSRARVAGRIHKQGSIEPVSKISIFFQKTQLFSNQFIGSIFWKLVEIFLEKLENWRVFENLNSLNLTLCKSAFSYQFWIHRLGGNLSLTQTNSHRIYFWKDDST